MKKPESLLWCHLATPGLNPDDGSSILEIYLRWTDMRAENTRGVYYGCLSSMDLYAHIEDDEARWMHARSGLLTDMAVSRTTRDEMVYEINSCLYEIGDQEIYLAGFAPGFCRKFLDEWVDTSVLHFQQLDVTSLEKFFRVVHGGDLFPRPTGARVKAKVDAAVEQYKKYVNFLEIASRALS